MTRTRLAFLVGVLAVAFGVVVAVRPGLASGVGTSQAMLSAVALIALYLTVRALRTRRRAEFERPALPTVESKYSFALPGTAFSNRLRAASASKRADGREELREDLHRLTVDVLTTYQGYSESEAEAAIDEGSWTDDPYAAAFFTFEMPDRSLGGRFEDALEGRVAFERRAKHVVAELGTVTEEL